MGLHFDEVFRVEVVVLGLFVVVTSKTFNRLDIVPKCEHLKMRYVSFRAVQAPGATISSCRHVFGKRYTPHELQISFTLRNRNPAVPDSGDHLSPHICHACGTPFRKISHWNGSTHLDGVLW